MRGHEQGVEAAHPTQAGADTEVLPGRQTLTEGLGVTRPVLRSGLIQRKAERDANGVAAGAGEHVAQAAASNGVPLPAELRETFEASLGRDLAGVRVHTGAASVTAARSVGAKAYTVGNDIHFGAGSYDPASSAGQHLLAHEVAHTVQQAGSPPTRQNKLEVSTAADAAEMEADRAAGAMIAGRATTISVSPGAGTVHRVGLWDSVKNAASNFFTRGSFSDPEESEPVSVPFEEEKDVSDDIEVQRAEQDLAIATHQLEQAQTAVASAQTRHDEATIALGAAKQLHMQAAGDGASKVPGTQANQRLAQAEQKVQKAEKDLEVAARALERSKQDVKVAEDAERRMQVKRDQAVRAAKSG